MKSIKNQLILKKGSTQEDNQEKRNLMENLAQFYILRTKMSNAMQPNQIKKLHPLH